MPQVHPPPTAADATLPERIGKYRVTRRLGEGATSEVFLAHDDFNQREVAIKRLRQGADGDNTEGTHGERFFAAEAALVGKLKHPNVVAIYDAVADPSQPYLVMEYVRGQTLRRYCRADLLLPLAQIVELGFKCAMALDYVFRQGVIHRDVKPANLLAVVEGDQVNDVKISDFGSALNLHSDRTQIFRVGSLAYMSPEQLDGDTVDCRADIYSLAGVLYHLIAGRAPFDATTQQAMMAQIYNAHAPALTELREGVPAGLSTLVMAALAKSPGDRPQNWEDVARALSSLTTNHEVPQGGWAGVRDSERFTLLRELEFFSGFGDVELWEVVHRARWQRFAVDSALYRKGQVGGGFHIIARGAVDVYRDGQRVAQLGAGTSVGEMAYLAPSEELRVHSADVVVTAPCTAISLTGEGLAQMSSATRHLFDTAFIRVLVRRLNVAHATLAHPRRIL